MSDIWHKVKRLALKLLIVWLRTRLRMSGLFSEEGFRHLAEWTHRRR